MAVFWDQIVIPRYEQDAQVNVDDILVKEGVVEVLDRRIPPEQIFPTSDGFDADSEWVYRFSRNDSGAMEVELVPAGPPDRDGSVNPEFRDFSDDELEAFAFLLKTNHLSYVDDSLAISTENNLAPISHSLGGHLAAVLGSGEGGIEQGPTREAALLSVVIEAFSIDPGTTAEEVLQFRSRHSRSQARLRSSLVDLASKLREGASPTTMLGEARDTYKNRVEPALGDLEEALKESRLKFFLKSIMGATAVAIAPIEPVSTSVGAAQIVGQTIDYSYSKSRLVQEHPYGYLHEVRSSFSDQNVGSRADAVGTLEEPERALARIWEDLARDAREFERKRLEQLPETWA